MNTKERITELENKMTFLEAANQEFSDLIYQQQKQLDQMKEYIKQAFSKLEAGPSGAEGTHEVPPHY